MSMTCRDNEDIPIITLRTFALLYSHNDNKIHQEFHINEFVSNCNAQMRILSNSNWGEPERAPHLMMSTAVCMSVCRSVVLFVVVRTYGKHLPEDELRVRVVARAL